MELPPNTPNPAELAGRAVALMTAWVTSPEDSQLVAKVWESFVDTDGTEAVTGTLISIGLINLCGRLLIDASEVSGNTILELLSEQGSYWAELAAEEAS
jgi:hypothetical protein